MNNIVSVKTNFTSGQVSPSLYARGDLGVYANGARKLENVIIFRPEAFPAVPDCVFLLKFPNLAAWWHSNSIPNKLICFVLNRLC